jgi:hypothetical protein
MSGLLDRDTSWWAKLDHADGHLARLRHVCDEYRARRPFYVEAEPTDRADEVQYRLHYEVEIPKVVPLIVGDILHNLRSALDSLVLGLIERDLNRKLSADEEKACQFPIFTEPKKFDEFFDHKLRNALTSSDLRDAMRSVQPFYHDEWAVKQGYIGAARYADNAEYDSLCTLNKMSNIDKHRRVAVTLLWPEYAGWGSDTGLDQRWRPGNGEFTDGAIVGYISGDVRPTPQLDYEFNLALHDLVPTDPREKAMFGSAQDVIRQAEAWRKAAEMTMVQLIHQVQR